MRKSPASAFLNPKSATPSASAPVTVFSATPWGQAQCEKVAVEPESFLLHSGLPVALAQVFPDDPLRGDFALFGYGVDHRSAPSEGRPEGAMKQGT